MIRRSVYADMPINRHEAQGFGGLLVVRDMAILLPVRY